MVFRRSLVFNIFMMQLDISLGWVTLSHILFPQKKVKLLFSLFHQANLNCLNKSFRRYASLTTHA